jgi:hypothetical protein
MKKKFDDQKYMGFNRSMFGGSNTSNGMIS